jgi:hypothetical protein
MSQAAAFHTSIQDDMLDCLMQAIRRHAAPAGKSITVYQLINPL